jgi:N-acetylneuraminic acid mutarotase
LNSLPLLAYGLWRKAAARSRELPPLPEAIAGQFVGVHAGRIVVAGGTIWSRPKWEGGEKRWTPAILTLGAGEAAWRSSGEQTEPLAYGGAVSTAAGVVCVGGQGPGAASSSVHLLWWDGTRIRRRALAELPEPRMLLAAALSGDAIFAVGGQISPTAATASSKVWLLDGVNERARWREASSLPGAGRILPAAAGGRGGVFVASGAALSAGTRTYLRDAFLYRPDTGWSSLPDLPAPVVGAPACCDSNGRCLIFGGDDGVHAGETPDPGPRHPGFSRTILRFDRGNWRATGRLPEGLVTSGVVAWRGSLVIPGGENRPGARTTRVLSVQNLQGQTR